MAVHDGENVILDLTNYRIIKNKKERKKHYLSLCNKQILSLETFNFLETIFFKLSIELLLSNSTVNTPEK